MSIGREWGKVPVGPAVYAMYGGRESGGRLYVAYVGVADKLKTRLQQHLIRRDSSVTTGTSATGLNVAYVTEVRWWTHPDFSNRAVLEAAELIAFEVLDPALRSRGRISDAARQLADKPTFSQPTKTLFLGPPTGKVQVPTLVDALEKIADLERRLADLEARFGGRRK